MLPLAFGGLRFGEATALRRNDVTADGTLVTIEHSVRHLDTHVADDDDALVYQHAAADRDGEIARPSTRTPPGQRSSRSGHE